MANHEHHAAKRPRANPPAPDGDSAARWMAIGLAILIVLSAAGLLIGVALR